MTLMQIVDTIREYKKQRKAVVDWMHAESEAGNLRQNSDCPTWDKYRESELKFWKAIDEV